MNGGGFRLKSWRAATVATAAEDRDGVCGKLQAILSDRAKRGREKAEHVVFNMRWDREGPSYRAAQVLADLCGENMSAVVRAAMLLVAAEVVRDPEETLKKLAAQEK